MIPNKSKKQTSVVLPEELMRQLKHAVVDSDYPHMSNFVEAAIKEKIENERIKKKRA